MITTKTLAVPGGRVDITATTTTTVDAVFVADAPSPPPPAPAPPPPAPTPPPPAPATFKTLQNYSAHTQAFGGPGWTFRSARRAPGPFKAVRLIAYNASRTASRTIDNHMVSAPASMSLVPSGWVDGAAGLVVPPSADPDHGTLGPAWALGNVIEIASQPAADGAPYPWLMVSAVSMNEVQWYCQPSNYNASEFAFKYPHRQLQSWHRGGNWAQASTASVDSSSAWYADPGIEACGGVMYLHDQRHVNLVVIGDSTGRGDGAMPGVTNYQSIGFIAAQKLMEQGVRVSFASAAIGGATWPKINAQLDAFLAAGVIDANTVVFLPSFTSNSNASASAQWAESQALQAKVTAAGGHVVVIGPMLSPNPDQRRKDVRALVAASGRAWVDVPGIAGTTADPSVWASGMSCDNDVHPSYVCNAACGAVAANAVLQVMA